jgi:drug/metabolite transporter (DMT)-like permease
VLVVAAAVALPIALAAEAGRFDLGRLWPFLAAGVAVPGFTQALVQWSIREAGVSRPMVVIGATPLVSVALAVGVRGEELSAVVGAGTVLVVLGTVVLAAERERPEHLRAAGLIGAGVCAAVFATRDNVVRAAATDYAPPPLSAGAASLLAGAAAGLALVLLVRRGGAVARVRAAVRPMLPAGLCLGAAYSSLVAAFSEGPVTTVVPLAATQSLWAVIGAWLVLGRSEQVGSHLVGAAIMIVFGSVLIGVAG